MDMQVRQNELTRSVSTMIRFRQVAKRFNKAEILKGIDLDIQAGNRVALVGSNGAGKTPLIR